MSCCERQRRYRVQDDNDFDPQALNNFLPRTISRHAKLDSKHVLQPSVATRITLGRKHNEPDKYWHFDHHAWTEVFSNQTRVGNRIPNKRFATCLKKHRCRDRTCDLCVNDILSTSTCHPDIAAALIAGSRTQHLNNVNWRHTVPRVKGNSRGVGNAAI